MGLEAFTQDEDERESSSKGSSKSSSSSNSGNSSNNRFPVYDKRLPYAVIKTEGGTFQSGDHESVMYPETPEMTWEKTWYNQPWKPAEAIPPSWEMYWWTESHFKLDATRVESELGLDLYELVRDKPERAVRAVRDARLSYESDSNTREAKKIRDCAVCDDPLNLHYSDYVSVGTRVVCSNHTAQDLEDADLLE